MAKSAVKTTLVCLTLILSVSFAYSLTVVSLSDEQLVRKSEIIVVGRVLSASYIKDAADGGRPYTLIQVRVSEYLKGKVRDRELTLKTLGGISGKLGMAIPGAADFNRNEEAVFFLERREDGSLFPVGMALGKFNIYRDESTGRKIVLRQEEGMGKYSAEPREEIIRDLELGRKVYFDDFRKRIHELVEREHRGTK